MINPCSSRGEVESFFSIASRIAPNALADRVSRFFSYARKRTVEDPATILSCLALSREFWINEYQGKEIELTAQNGNKINGMHFKGQDSCAILFLHGNGCFYESSLERPLEWIAALNKEGVYPDLLTFNPRGTGKSEGITHPQHVAEDILVAFRYLVGQGIDPDRVIIAGHSMGGFFGAFGAQLVQQEFPGNSIHFLSDRSFKSIEDRINFGMQNVEGSKWKKEIVYVAIHRLKSLWGWNANPLAALETLKGRVGVLYHKADEIVPYKTSLHALIQEQPSLKRPYSFFLLGDEPCVESGSEAHNRNLSSAEMEKLIPEMKQMLKGPIDSP